MIHITFWLNAYSVIRLFSFSTAFVERFSGLRRDFVFNLISHKAGPEAQSFCFIRLPGCRFGTEPPTDSLCGPCRGLRDWRGLYDGCSGSVYIRCISGGRGG